MPLTGLRVLLVDDSADIRRLFAHLLAVSGAEVETRSGGREAVDRVLEAGAERPDLVVMDMQMPGMDGPTAIEAIRAAGSPVPVLTLTANTEHEGRARCEAAGTDGFVTKPIGRAAFVRACLACIDAARNRNGRAEGENGSRRGLGRAA